MNVVKAIKTRRSIRKYTTEIVLPVDAIEEWKGQFKKIETETNFLKKNKFPFKAK